MYAQVNRDKKKNSRNANDPTTPQPQMMMHYGGDYSEHADHWQHPPPQPPQHIHGPSAAPAGDSWV